MKSLIELRGLSYAYPDGTRALSELDFRICEGERVALIGPNGAGKTTLLLHLNGLILPQAGSVRVDGLEVKRANLPELRRRVGFVFQNPDDQLFLPTIGEDVAFGPRNFGFPEAEVVRRVASALERVGLAGREEKLCFNLSLGEKKRASLATVLAGDPRLLVFDEPTASLDPAGQRQIAGLLSELDLTMLIASHDLVFIRKVCSRVILLDGGRIHADGPAGEILDDGGRLAAHALV
ncbi:MAG TPA: ABC transporter ATP-binding protein [bacterium]|nr:ABC transporter ATP-binding protein [bacterium]HNS48594.1 ABC transporter ATP-binding protein [bacterium]